MLGGKEFETDHHNYYDFSSPSAMFVGTYSDEGFDEDGDGYYDYLRVTVPVTFNETGWYEVSGELYQEEEWYWHWITWSHNNFEVTDNTTQDIIIDFSAIEIMKSEREGQFGVNLWLRAMDTEMGRLEFTTDNYYYLNQFDQPSVRFTDDSPRDDSLSGNGKYLNVTLAINSSEVGTYYLNGHMHKVIDQGHWEDWYWLAHTEMESKYPLQTSVETFRLCHIHPAT